MTHISIIKYRNTSRYTYKYISLNVLEKGCSN
nr:MAG TPA: hypothetical protein [Caudoviricetes sp.]